MRKSGSYFNSTLKLLLIFSVGCSSVKTVPTTVDTSAVVILKAPMYITDSTGKVFAIIDTNNNVKVFDSSETIKTLLKIVEKIN